MGPWKGWDVPSDTLGPVTMGTVQDKGKGPQEVSAPWLSATAMAGD